MIVKKSAQTGKVRVTFSMPSSIWADTIHLVGDFNNWNQTATPLELDEHGWTVSLELEANRAYQYRYLVNGTDWYNDWRADRYEPNEFGGDNSVVVTLVQRELPTEQPQPLACEVGLEPVLQHEFTHEHGHALPSTTHYQPGTRARKGRAALAAMVAMKNST